MLLHNGRDLCDCMEEECPGCHFPCHKCRSSKCGYECRINRKWQYETCEFDGDSDSLFYNPHLVNPPTNKPMAVRKN